MFDWTVKVCKRLGIDPPNSQYEEYLPKVMEIFNDVLNRLDDIEDQLDDTEPE